MNNPGEHKPAQQQQQPPQQQAAQMRRSFRYELIVGIILGGVAVGVFMPLIAKRNARKAKSTHIAMSARSGDDSAAPQSKTRSKTREIEKEREEEEDEDDAIEADDAQASLEAKEVKKVKAKVRPRDKDAEGEPANDTPPVAKAAKAEPAKSLPSAAKVVKADSKKAGVATPPSPVPTPAAKTPRTQPKVAAKVASLAAATPTPSLAAPRPSAAASAAAPAPAPVARPAAPVKGRDLGDSSVVLTAKDVEAKSDEVMLDKIATSQNNNPFQTINNSAYQKEVLTNCRSRCLLVTKANGKTTNAIISGPHWAEALREHEGTINITGKKAMVKSHEVFVVQSITFNLPPPKPVATPKAPAPAIAPPVAAPNPAFKGDKPGAGEGYEDLGAP